MLFSYSKAEVEQLIISLEERKHRLTSDINHSMNIRPWPSGDHAKINEEFIRETRFNLSLVNTMLDDANSALNYLLAEEAK